MSVGRPFTVKLTVPYCFGLVVSKLAANLYVVDFVACFSLLPMKRPYRGNAPPKAADYILGNKKEESTEKNE